MRYLFSYMAQHKLLGLDEEPNYDFLGHPINAYLFVRHVAHGWSFIKESLEKVDLNKTQDFGNHHIYTVF